MPCRGISIIRILTPSGFRSIGIYIYISYNFIKVKYSRPNWSVIFITNENSGSIYGIIRRSAKKTVVVIYKVMYTEHCENNLRIEAIDLSTMNHLIELTLVYMH